MSSTDARLRDLFDRLLQIAATLPPSRARLPGPDPAVDTYYVSRRARVMRPVDFLPAGSGSGDGLDLALAELWQGLGYPELADLAPRIAALARDLRRTEQQADEVDPFIYAMF